MGYAVVPMMQMERSQIQKIIEAYLIIKFQFFVERRVV